MKHALVLLAVLACGKDHDSSGDWKAMEAYAPAARELAEASAPRCAAAAAPADNPHPARGGALEADALVRDVTVGCWRDGKLAFFLGNDPKLGEKLKPSPAGEPISAVYTQRRSFILGEFPEGSVTAPDHRSEYVDLPAGAHPRPYRTLVVQRPAPGGWIAVSIDVALK